MMNKYSIIDGEIKNNYTDRIYSIEDVCRILNELDRQAQITQRDLTHCIELKAVNRHLKIENRFLTIKLQQLCWRGMMDVADIEKEISDLCLNPEEASGYIHKFEKENFELKQKLTECGEYSDDLL